MNVRRVMVTLASIAALFGSTAVSADDGSSQVIRATVQVAGGLAITLELDDDSVSIGRETEVEAEATNGTGRPLVAVILTLHVDEPGVSIRGGRLRVIPMLWPGQSRKATWRVCPERRGKYLLLATGAAFGRRLSEGLDLAQSDTVLLTATGGSRRCNGRGDRGED